VIWNDGRLAVREPDGDVKPMEPTGNEGEWTVQNGTKVVSFVLDDDGKIIAMSVVASRTFPRVHADS